MCLWLHQYLVKFETLVIVIFFVFVLIADYIGLHKSYCFVFLKNQVGPFFQATSRYDNRVQRAILKVEWKSDAYRVKRGSCLQKYLTFFSYQSNKEKYLFLFNKTVHIFRWEEGAIKSKHDNILEWHRFLS